MDLISDDSVIQICTTLKEEKDIVSMGLTCKHYLKLIDHEQLWAIRSLSWHALRQLGSIYDEELMLPMIDLKKFYRRKFEEQKQLQHKLSNKEEKTVTQYIEKVWLHPFSAEIPFLIMTLLWIILLTLRVDEIVLYSYHIVAIPLYIALLHFFGVMFAADIINFYFLWHGDNVIWKGNGLMVLLAKQPYFWKWIIYSVWICISFSVILIHESWDEDDILPSGYALLPFVVIFLIHQIYYLHFLIHSPRPPYFLRISMFLLFIFSYSVELLTLALIWIKMEEYINISWEVAMVPLWTLGTPFCFFLVAYALFGENMYFFKSGYLFFLMIVYIWFFLFAMNMSAISYDKPAWSWTSINLPLYASVIFLCFWIVNHPIQPYGPTV